MTFRLPITDIRGFSSDPHVADSVVLPRAWEHGDFVRGLGRITRRPGGSVEPWSLETAFADMSRTILFDNSSLEGFNRDFSAFTVHKVRKRAWMALADSTALLDVDVALQVAPRSNRRIPYPRGGQFSLLEIKRVVGRAAALTVRIRSSDSAVTSMRLLTAGKPLAARFANQTSRATSVAKSLVYSGRTIVVLEAPGLVPSDVVDVKSEQLNVGGINLVSFDAPVEGGGNVRCHVLWDASGNKGNRKLIRELRIHILRLHSFYELMHRLTSGAVTSANSSISDVHRTPGFDALQQTLLSCVRTIQTAKRPGGVAASAVLDAAFFARSFSEGSLANGLDRMVSAMRPKVRSEVIAFQTSEERRMRENAIAEQERRRQGNTVIVKELNLMGKYEINGGTNGAIGDNARVENSVIGVSGAMVAIGDTEVLRGTLLMELSALRQSLVSAGQEDARETVEAVESAEAELRIGRDDAAIKSLRKAGLWAVNASTAIGAGVAAAAIAAALGLS